MKFKISIASDYFRKENPCPCEGAYRDGDGWAIDIDTAEQLMAIVRLNYRGVVVNCEAGITTIEIYDSYIE